MPNAAQTTMTEEEKRAATELKQRQFERTLAGASVEKAGITRDQTEINRIIAEASKGTKFYQNQVRKDEELNAKIAWFQAKRDELMRGAQVERLEAEAERILVEVEALRDLSQTIVHVDMDMFYAAVEVQRDPSLKGKAFGVGGGVLCTASYEARKYGCRSGMAGWIARKLCPHIIITDLHFDLYGAASKKVREVLKGYDENLAMAGLDEGYLNITPYMASHDMSAMEVVEQLRQEVEATTGLTISAGIAPNRMLAKICSDKNKPNGAFELEFNRDVITKFMRDLPVRKIPGFGRVTERCLEGLGVEVCGDIYTRRAEVMVMSNWFGFRGLCKAYLGIADNTVQPGKREQRKSVGVERTFRDKSDENEILSMLENIAEELEGDMKRLQYAGRCVTVKYKLHTFENKSRAHSVSRFIDSKEDILPIAMALMRREFPVRIRLLGIRMSTLKDLTVPDKGIKKFFGSPSKTASASEVTPGPSRGTLDSIDLTLDGDFVVTPDDGRAGDTELNELDPSPSLEGVTCPICGRTLEAGTSNAELNEHIDLCLNQDAFGDECAAGPSSPPKKRARSGTPATRPAESHRAGASAGGGGKKRRAAKAGSAGSGFGSSSKAKPGSVLDWLKRGQ